MLQNDKLIKKHQLKRVSEDETFFGSESKEIINYVKNLITLMMETVNDIQKK